VAESAGEEALHASVLWCPWWVGVGWVWSVVEVLQCVLLDESLYCGLRWSCGFVGVLNEWQDVVEYSVNL